MILSKERIRVLNFHGIYDTENYTVISMEASNIKFQQTITGQILDLRY